MIDSSKLPKLTYSKHEDKNPSNIDEALSIIDDVFARNWYAHIAYECSWNEAKNWIKLALYSIDKCEELQKEIDRLKYPINIEPIREPDDLEFKYGIKYK